MTTPRKKAQLEAKRKIKEREKAGDTAETPKPEIPVIGLGKKKSKVDIPLAKNQEDIKESEAFIIDDKVKVVKYDPMGYMVAIDVFYIREVQRISYNVLAGELIIVLPEVAGRIFEADVDVTGAHGQKTGGKRREITGQITMFKTSITDEKTIREFLKVWYEGTKVTEQTFEGFKHHKLSQEIIEKAIQAKQKEQDSKSPILSPHTGQPVKK